MPKMTNVKVLCLIAAVACLVQLSVGAPVSDGHEGNDIVDEIISRLRLLKQQSEGKRKMFCVLLR